MNGPTSNLNPVHERPPKLTMNELHDCIQDALVHSTSWFPYDPPPAPADAGADDAGSTASRPVTTMFSAPRLSDEVLKQALEEKMSEAERLVARLTTELNVTTKAAFASAPLGPFLRELAREEDRDALTRLQKRLKRALCIRKRRKFCFVAIFNDMDEIQMEFCSMYEEARARFPDSKHLLDIEGKLDLRCFAEAVRESEYLVVLVTPFVSRSPVVLAAMCAAAECGVPMLRVRHISAVEYDVVSLVDHLDARGASALRIIREQMTRGSWERLEQATGYTPIDAARAFRVFGRSPMFDAGAARGVWARAAGIPGPAEPRAPPAPAATTNECDDPSVARLVTKFFRHTTWVTCVGFVERGAVLLTGSNVVGLVACTTQELAVLTNASPQRETAVMSIALSPSSAFMACGDCEGRLALYATRVDADGLHQKALPWMRLRGHGRYTVHRLSFACDDKRLASAGLSSDWLIHEFPDPQPKYRLKRSQVDVLAIGTTFLVTWSFAGRTLVVRSAATGAPLHEIPTAPAELAQRVSVKTMVFSSDASKLLVGWYGGDVELFRFDDPDSPVPTARQHIDSNEAPVGALCFGRAPGSRGELRVAAGTMEGRIRVYQCREDAAAEEKQKSGARSASKNPQEFVRICELKSWLRVGYVAMAFSPDGTRFVSGATTNGCDIWEFLPPRQN